MSKRLALSLMPAVALSLAALAIFLTSCGTMRNVTIDDPKGNRVFGGVRYDAEHAVECVAGPPAARTPDTGPAADKAPETGAAAVKAHGFQPLQLIELTATAIDAPLSFAGDTLTLPWVAYVRLREFADRHKPSNPPPASAEKP
jgi:uncharacterized protein YceK